MRVILSVPPQTSPPTPTTTLQQQDDGTSTNPTYTTTASTMGGDDPGDGLATGTCLDFSPLPGSDHLFLVGTEEGAVHKCSRAYSGQVRAWGWGVGCCGLGGVLLPMPRERY